MTANVDYWSNPDDWRIGAACRGLDLALWFPPKGGRADDAIRICRTCDVTAECLADAFAHGSLDDKGIRGGLYEKDRRRMRSGTSTRSA